MIDIVKAGILTTVQDLGRRGLRHLGVTQGGALDGVALRVANRLVGNAPDSAGLEITVGQTVVLQFGIATRIALTGADCAAMLDGKPVHAWWSVAVRAGQQLTLNAMSRGMRAYLAVAGGIDVAPVLGSRSTDLGAAFGGIEGRALRDGDRIPLACHALDAQTLEAPAFGVKPPAWCDFAQVRGALGISAANRRKANDYPRTGQEPQWIRLMRGPDYASFSAAAHDALWHAEWTVTPSSNRMGYRLAGPALQRHRSDNLLSHAVLPGTLQVPPSGQPILLMGDAQTAGGYPKIGVVASADLWRLAQTRLNTPLRFVEYAHADARVALQRIERYFTQLDLMIRVQHRRSA